MKEIEAMDEYVQSLQEKQELQVLELELEIAELMDRYNSKVETLLKMKDTTDTKNERIE